VSASSPTAPASLLDLDWRFLLPPPAGGRFARLLLLGGSAAVAELATQVGLAREATVDPSESADAVVCLQGSPLSLAEAALRVERGGVLYYEGLRRGVPPFGVPARRAAASLRRLGLAPCGVYVVHPAFTGARTYFPLEPRRAVEWYLRSRRAAPTAAARALPLLTDLAGRIAPRFALVAVSGTTGRGGLPLPSEVLPPPLRRDGLHALVLVHGDERSRVVMLPFATASREPLAVLKLHRRQLPAGESTHEQAALAQLRARLGPELRATVPEPLGIVRAGAVAASAESFLRGEWLYARWGRRGLRQRELIEDLELTVAWLTAFQRESRVELRRWDSDEIERSLEVPLSEYEQAFGATAPEARLFARLRAQARELVGLPVPVVWQHGDFSSYNVLRSGRAIHVVDWEAAAPALPLDDLLYFVTRWLYRAHGVTPEHVGDTLAELRASGGADSFRSFGRLFLEPVADDPAVSAARAALASYLRSLEIDARLVPLLLVLAWVRRAVGRLDRQATPGWMPDAVERPESAREGNRYVTYVELLAARPERLFVPSAWT
jgi:hypothetical protein